VESFGSFGVQYYDRRNNICHAGRGFDELQKEVRGCAQTRRLYTTTEAEKTQRLAGCVFMQAGTRKRRKRFIYDEKWLNA